MNPTCDSDMCQVCGCGDSEETNEIVYCESCNIPVHQLCYGIEDNIKEIDWYCMSCRAFPRDKDIMRVQCGLCGAHGGAMRPSNLKSEVFHML